MRHVTMGKYLVPEGIKPFRKGCTIDWEWIVIHEDEEKMLLLSRDVMDWDIFDDKYTFFADADPATWDESYLRGLLKKYYKENFSEKEKNRILPKGMGDYLFILTAEEVEFYLPTKDVRVAEIIYADENMRRERYDWWLNSVGVKKHTRQRVDENGEIDRNGIEDECMIGVRPAMWVDISSK